MKEQRLGTMILSAVLLPLIVLAVIAFVAWDISILDLSEWIPPVRFLLIILVVVGAGVGSGISDALGFRRFL